ncbi:MAG TPA: sensor histidine kinase, partial [Euzebyales bacterium]|nr:sensor histidine kinase [Euzebyales bacterium]
GGGLLIGPRMTDLSETRRQMVTDLETALRENAGLHAQLVTQAREAGVLDERQRLAREIHDTLAQGLTGIITQLEAASRATERPAERDRHIDTATRLARESLTEARRSVRALHPEPLDNARLPEALAVVGERRSTVNGVHAQVTTTGTTRPLHPAVEVTLLRVAQEALANVARHAAASRAVVTLSYMDDVVTLDVRDDGVGFAPDATRTNGDQPVVSGYGLTAMRQRIDQFAGTFHVESEPGAGTSVSVSVPALPPGATDA